MTRFAVVDFETNGQAPQSGGRATEIAIVRVEDGRIVDHYQSLMRTEAWIPPFIEQLTGINQAMLREAPPAETVMREAAAWAEGCALVAHNAAFDRSVWRAELAHASCDDGAAAPPFLCTVRLSRRIHPEAPSHKLGELARWHGLPDTGRAHRALADAMMTAQLLLRQIDDLRQRHARVLEGVEISLALLQALQTFAAPQVGRRLREWSHEWSRAAAPAVLTPTALASEGEAVPGEADPLPSSCRPDGR